MGASASSLGRLHPQPEDIGEFRKLPSRAEYYIIPEVPEKRKVTDFKFTIVFAVCLAVLLPFLIYTFVHSDLNRFVHGYDKCGNVCGEKNSHVDNISCSGQDKTNLPYLTYTRASGRLLIENGTKLSDFVQDECVKSCDENYVKIFWGCFPKGNTKEDVDTEALFSDILDALAKSAGYIVVLSLIGFGFCVGTMFLFRYFVNVFIWFVLIISLAGFIAVTGLLWFVSSTNSENNGLFYLAILFSIISVILIIVLICMFKRIKLLIRLFKEAIKIIFGIPLILFEPLLTVLACSILGIIFVLFVMIMASSGSLRMAEFGLYEYYPNGAMMFTLWYHVVICIWMYQFIIGCQHMVISGAVSAYYFARDKSTLSAPVYNSFYNLMKYHLGTVAFGSLIITVVAIIKALIRGLTNSKHAKFLVDCCLGMIEDFLKYLSKNAYIQTAMHGQPFYKSGKRAVTLLAANAISAITINSVGDFILFMVKLMIIVCTALVGVLFSTMNDIEHFWVAIVVSVFITGVIAHCFFAVYETAIDTIFLCFCEDSSMNDGMDRPYYMTTDLMQYMVEAKQTANDNSRQ